MRGRIVRCENHPEYEAIAFCIQCGRSICEFCNVNVMDVPHCKFCAESIIIQMTKRMRKSKIYRPPRPKGPPSSRYFIFGYVGSFLMAIGALLLWILGMDRRFDILSRDVWEIFWLGGISFLSIGLAITALGFYGFYINYGSTLGYICLIILPLGGMFFLAIFLYSFFINFEVGRFSTGLGALGIGMVLMGLTILSVEKYTLTGWISKITAIIMFAATGLVWVVFVTEGIGLGWMVLFAGCLFMGIFFIRIKMPLRNIARYSSPHPMVRTSNSIGTISLKEEGVKIKKINMPKT
jgi:hypothetical protein